MVPQSRICSYGEKVELVCVPQSASLIYWKKNGDHWSLTNETNVVLIIEAGLSSLSFTCENSSWMCCYELNGQYYCGNQHQAIIVMRK